MYTLHQMPRQNLLNFMILCCLFKFQFMKDSLLINSMVFIFKKDHFGPYLCGKIQNERLSCLLITVLNHILNVEEKEILFLP